MPAVRKVSQWVNVFMFCSSAVFLSTALWKTRPAANPTTANRQLFRSIETTNVRERGSSIMMEPSSSLSDVSEQEEPLVAGVPCPKQKSCIDGLQSCKDNSSLPELLFVAGTEGSGHSLIRSLFLNLAADDLQQPYTVYTEFTPSVHLMDPHGIQNASNMGFAIIHTNLFRSRLKPILDSLAQASSEQRKGVLLSTHSFPMGLGGILSTARPDLLLLRHFDCVLYKLKIIVVKRHPVLSVLSSVRRFGRERFKGISVKGFVQDPNLRSFPPVDYPYIMQARIIEDELIYLHQQLQQLDCSQVHFININDIFSPNKREEALNALATYLGFNSKEMGLLQRVKLQPPAHRDTLPPACDDCTMKVLYEFFEERKSMWPLLAV